MNSIANYQNAFNSAIEQLKANESVLAVMVFGSMITGDLWEGSDIDLFVILDDDKLTKIMNVYTEEDGIPVHIKMMSKQRFLQFHEEDLIGGEIHRIFISSRLVFSKDKEVTSRYDIGRYYPDIEREKWNMFYLGELLKSIKICKKYLSLNIIYTAYVIAIKCAENYAKLFVNFSGYMVSNDVMSMAINLNDEYKKYNEKLLFDKKDIVSSINKLIKFIEKDIDLNLKNYTILLTSFLREKDCFLSTEEINDDVLFNNFNIDFEGILNILWKKNIIKKERKQYITKYGKVLLRNNVYYI